LPESWCNDKAKLEADIFAAVIDNNNWLNQTNFSFLQLIHQLNV